MSELTLTMPPGGREVLAHFIVPGEPASKSRARFTKRGSKTVTYTPEKTKQAEERMAWVYRSKGGRRHDGDTTVAYGVCAVFFHSHNQRRDVDNMLKLILDGLNDTAWPDDNQVLEVAGRKQWVEKGEERTEVCVYRVGTIERPSRTCAHCSTSFPTYPSTAHLQKFCSRECSLAWRRERRKRTCLHCDEEFLVHGVSKPTKFCSEACETAASNIELICIECGTTYLKPRSLASKGYALCSQECRAEHWRKQRKRAAKGTCAACGGPTSKKTYTHCRVCAPIARSRAGFNAASGETF